MKIWIDGDAAPGDAKEIVFRAAQRLELETVLVANRPLGTPRHNAHVRSVAVPGGPDAADRYIAEHAGPGDLAITADIPLAAELVEKGLVVLDPRGDEYSRENVRERLSVRDFMASLRGAGVETGGAKPFGPRDRHAFAAALDRVLTAALRDGRRSP
ncbi:MAG: YaiI/YqxD family protein [Gemmatimonadetes bacterium]|nr:YaiI/YqxD family protein [Gemmatimonadota bacterium]NIQ57278.1 YaiI/YqxD family protein [Gemmatimonadota bacterium]NIU77443.1 YaiI/YqxD family protein [Gammaproteobacteria bacterium]NIX46675.1 YaiI/YqxD family protein [Gemmatimonadota bacterium]NIY11018.1 YaiI/YqxD family protein [Gemmatimonadota bacterium]